MTGLQISEHKSELGWWRVVQRSADPRLRAFVNGYIGSKGYAPKAIRERHVPSAEVGLLINFGSAHRRLDPGDSTWMRHDDAWVIGLHSNYHLTEAVGEREFIAVRFTPMGAHLFFRVPMDLIANRVIELKHLNRELALRLWSRLARAVNWESRFAVIESLIAERLMSEASRAGVALAAWNRLEGNGGQVRLGSLAPELECSQRHLIAQFRQNIGLPPKLVARVLRFGRAVRVINRLGRNLVGEPSGKPYIEGRETEVAHNARIGWADVAAECGYFDQSHFIKEFHAFAGLTPVEFLYHLDAE